MLAALCGCAPQKLLVQSEYMTRDRYASVFVGTPDPKKYCPDLGQRLSIQWKLKDELKTYREVLLHYKIVLRNYERVEETLRIRCPVGRIFYNLMNEDFYCTDGIMSYRVQIWGDGCLLAETRHHLYHEVIQPPPLPEYDVEPDEIYFDPIDDLDAEENPDL